ncbi:TPA: glycosyltransferase [Clostridium botulinum]|nr:glycosyltransferase [Clostridium botulinum]NFB53033.1 glycosyltransferase [Clostridium botulinum]NFB56523.1 glycosyltransferase [Clostridium botulinum]NFB60810.1 glycosyltransferase [Clostridium botulinum]NFC78426.1 glycosyltransferase [Clostridium botulinum]
MSFDVSAVIPCYNCENFIEETVSSLLSQTIQLKEIILINDASTDNTAEILRQIEEKNKDIVKVIDLKKNKGASYARNYGVKISRGDYILFMDSDDVAELMLIENYRSRLQELNYGMEDKYALCYSAYIQIDEKDNEISEIIKGIQVEPEEILGYEFLRNYIISTSGVVVYKKLFLECGGFNEKLVYSEDWDLWLKLAMKGGFAYINKPMVKIRRHLNNISSNIKNMLEGERKVLSNYNIDFIESSIYRRNLPYEKNTVDFVSMLFKLDYWKEGYNKLSQTISLGYSSDSLLFYLGLYYLKRNCIKEARINFDKTLTLNSSHGAALNNMGGIYLLMNNKELAKEYFLKALKIYSNYIDANFNLELLNNSEITKNEIKFTWRELRGVLISYV